jgi:hypothetical protein
VWSKGKDVERGVDTKINDIYFYTLDVFLFRLLMLHVDLCNTKKYDI